MKQNKVFQFQQDKCFRHKDEVNSELTKFFIFQKLSNIVNVKTSRQILMNLSFT